MPVGLRPILATPGPPPHTTFLPRPALPTIVAPHGAARQFDPMSWGTTTLLMAVVAIFWALHHYVLRPTCTAPAAVPPMLMVAVIGDDDWKSPLKRFYTVPYKMRPKLTRLEKRKLRIQKRREYLQRRREQRERQEQER
eukprot:EG_transcript_34694